MERERRQRRSKREKLEEELAKTEEAIRQYQGAICTMEAKKEELMNAIELEEIREVTKLMKERSVSVGELKKLIDQEKVQTEAQGA